jgi:hypothetical protein
MIYLLQYNPNINLFLYEVNKDKYKNYVELLDINAFTSEPTEKYIKTNCPSLNQSIILNTYIPTINNNSNNTNNITSNNDNKNIIIIVVTTISTFFIVIIIFIKYQKKKRKKEKEKEKEIIFNENFGTRYDELIDF